MKTGTISSLQLPSPPFYQYLTCPITPPLPSPMHHFWPHTWTICKLISCTNVVMGTSSTPFPPHGKKNCPSTYYFPHYHIKNLTANSTSRQPISIPQPKGGTNPAHTLSNLPLPSSQFPFQHLPSFHYCNFPPLAYHQSCSLSTNIHY